MAGAFPLRGDCLFPYWERTAAISHAADHVLVTDLDGDGKPEIVGNDASSIFVLHNDGTGLFAAPVTVYSGTVVGNPLIADFNGDGKTDVLFAQSGALVMLPGAGGLSFGATVTSSVTINASLLAAAAMNSDASADVVAIDAAASVLAVFANDGAGHFTEASRVSVGANAQAMTVADFDHDGMQDVTVAYKATSPYQAFYGNGDGTLQAAQVVYASSSAYSLRSSDLTGDDLGDFTVALRTATATIRNLGGRAFGDPLYYYPDNGAWVNDVLAADLTGDGIPDLLGASSCDIVTFTGSGIGTMDWSYGSNDANCTSNYISTLPVSLAAGDLDADGRVDAVLAYSKTSSQRVINTYRNRCGDGQIRVTTESPTLSVGQPAVLEVQVTPPTLPSLLWWWLPSSGDVTVHEGATAVGNGTITSQDTAVTFTPSGAGDHSYVVSYAGDRQYGPLTSDPLLLHVTNDTTTTTLRVFPTRGEYGAPTTVFATVTPSTGDAASGNLTFTIDGVSSSGYLAAPEPTSSITVNPTVGTHTYSVRYLGDSAHPPSSATINYAIAKQTPRIGITPPSVMAGTSGQVLMEVLPRLAAYYNSSVMPTGNVTVSQGSAQLVSKTYTGSTAVPIPALAAGTYELRVTYSGDENYNATEAFVPLLVFGAGLSLDARGTADGVMVTWGAPSTVILERKLPSQTWAQAGSMCCSPSPWWDTYPAVETVYQYRFRLYDGSGTGPVDIGMRTTFTNEGLAPGTLVRAAHFQEIVRVANILRAAASLPALSLPGIAAGTIPASEVTALRNGINEARTALGAFAFPFTGTIHAGDTILAAQVREMREAVR
jgi:hypothetical protein